jgi:hypothetical protein
MHYNTVLDIGVCFFSKMVVQGIHWAVARTNHHYFTLLRGSCETFHNILCFCV